MNHEIIIKRLALIKYLFSQGIQQSKNSEPLLSFAILSFHDSVEMFLKLLAEKENIPVDYKTKFNHYWEKIPTLTLKESLSGINVRRNNFKHKGILPSKLDIEEARVTTSNFFQQNTFAHFGIKFEDISLLNLVKYDIVKQHLQKAYSDLKENNYSKSIDESTFAFHQLINTYESSKEQSFSSPFNFTSAITRYDWMSFDEDKPLKDFKKKVKDTFNEFNFILKVIGLGIDFKKYVKFSILTPKVYLEQDMTYHTYTDDKEDWTLKQDNVQFLIDFVIESSLRIQEFDFEISEMLDS